MTHGASGVEAALSRRARVSRPRLGASGRASLDEGLLEELSWLTSSCSIIMRKVYSSIDPAIFVLLASETCARCY